MSLNALSQTPLPGTTFDALAATPSAADDAQEQVLALFDAHAPGLGRYVQSCGLTREAAEDIVQDAFLALYRHLCRGGNADNLRGWLFRVSHRLAMKARHRHRRIGRWQLPWHAGAELLTDAAADPERQVLHREQHQSVRAIFAALPERDRQCFYLRAEGLRYRQIAETLGVSLGAVAKSLARGMARLSTAVTDERR